MPTSLQRRHHTGQLHFITASCFRKQPFLGTPTLRDLLQDILFETVERYQSIMTAYVLMPEHIHLILSEPEKGTIATVLQILKQRYSVAMKKQDYPLYLTLQERTAHPPPAPVWETRYYDFNLDRADTLGEKISYIHMNPVRRRLAADLQGWKWSSYTTSRAASSRGTRSSSQSR